MEKLSNKEKIQSGDKISIVYSDGFSVNIILVDKNNSFIISDKDQQLIDSGNLDLITTDSPVGKELLEKTRGETFEVNLNNHKAQITIK